MRLLCIDHYFDQDIEALRRVAPSGTRCWAVTYGNFFKLAVRHFPEEVFTGIEAYFRPEHAQARAAYAVAAQKQVERLYRIYRFDAVVAPSDTFFWIRAPIEAVQRLGIPFVVLQKEATIPPAWMDAPAREWGEISPFIADYMLVSSEHHRRFWINSGVDPSIVVVTGQPRFDVYARGGQRRSSGERRPAVLFLTYDVNAYLPVIDRTGLAPWRRLRVDTEGTLVELARRDEIELLVKAHPQPAEDQSAHLAELATLPGVRILDPHGDVRRHIVDADVVVGFQSTALLESLASGTPTVYTWWTEPALAHANDLIPFHKEPDALAVATSPAELEAAVERLVAEPPRPPSAAAMRLVEQYLGPVDGRASERCWTELERLVAAAARAPAEARLAAGGRGRGVGTAVTVGAAAVGWTLVERLAQAAYPAYRARARLQRRQPVDAAAFRSHLAGARRLAVQDLAAIASRRAGAR
jgi:hypothetical protein